MLWTGELTSYDFKLPSSSVRRCLTHENEPGFTQRVAGCIFEFIKTKNEVLLFPLDISLGNMRLLWNLAKAQNCVLLLAESENNLEGIGLVSMIDFHQVTGEGEVYPSDQYVDKFVNRVRLEVNLDAMTRPLKSSEVFTHNSLSRQELAEHLRRDIRLAIGSYWEDNIAREISDFVGDRVFTTQSHMRYAFERTVRRVHIPRRIRRQEYLTKVFSQLQFLKARRFKQHDHSLWCEKAGHIHWWGRPGKMKPLESEPYPESLLRFTNILLRDDLKVGEGLEMSCLPVFYRHKKASLGWHSDIFLKEITGRAEEVLLVYLGGSRELVFRPITTKHKPYYFQLFKVNCKQGDAYQLSPLANEMFMHRKPKSPDASDSLTLAYRLAISMPRALTFFPELRKFYTP